MTYKVKRSFVITFLVAVVAVCTAALVAIRIKPKQTEALSASDVVAFGIDISVWQSSVNYSAIHNQGGVQFVIAKASQGTSIQDSKFKTHIDGSLAAGMHVGAYHYAEATTVATAHSEASYMLSVLSSCGYSPSTFSYPIYYDYEHSSVSSLSVATNTAIINAFCGDIAAAGYYPGLYMGGYLFNNKVNRSGLMEMALWVAAYGSNSSDAAWSVGASYVGTPGEGGGKVGMWQYSSTGGVTGYSGNLDKDYCFVDYPAITGNGVSASGRWTSNGDGSYSITQANSHIETSGYEDGGSGGTPFLIRSNPNSWSPTYAVQARFENTNSTAMETLQYGTVKMGFCPYYVDSNNFILIYMYWAKSESSTRMRSVNANICYNGNWADRTIAWVHDQDAYSALWHNSNWSSGYWLHCDVSKTAIRVMINDLYIGALEDTDQWFKTLSRTSSRIGCYSWWSGTKVSDIGTWDVTYWNESSTGNYSILANDAVEQEWTQGNFCDMSIFNNYAQQSKYITSATFNITSVKGTVQKFGYAPMYLDEDNYVLVFLKWNENVSPNMASVVISGKEQGNAIYGSGYYDLWIHDSTQNVDALKKELTKNSVWVIKCLVESDGITVWVNDTLVIGVDGNSKVSLTGYSGGVTGNNARMTLYSYHTGLTVNNIAATNNTGNTGGSGSNGGDTGNTGGNNGGDTGNTDDSGNNGSETQTPAFTIKFNKNGGTGSMSSLKVTCGQKTQLSASKFKRTGYSFVGWATSANGAVVYTDAQEISDIAQDGETVTLYAVWVSESEASTDTEAGVVDSAGIDVIAGCTSGVALSDIYLALAVCGFASLMLLKKFKRKEN